VGITRCTSGFLSAATCEKIQICNLATSFEIARRSSDNSSLADSVINARVEVAQASLVAVPTVSIASSSASYAKQMAQTAELGHVYVGSGELVEAGMHAGLIVVGEQPCLPTMLKFNVECRAGFTWNGRQCSKTADQSVCALTAISLSHSAGPSLPFDLRGHALIGSKLEFAVAQPHLSSCRVARVPVPEASSSFSARTRVPLNLIGTYAVKGQCPSKDSCFFSRFGQYTMVCPPGKQAVGRLCKQAQLNCTGSFLLEAGQCKRLPMLALSSSTVLLIEVEKIDPFHSAASVTIDAKLTAGDFAVDWAVVNATDARIDHTNGQGRVSPSVPSSSVNFTISARGLPDYSVESGDRKMILHFQSQLSEQTQRALVSGFVGQVANVPLSVRVMSRAYLTRQSLRLFSKSEGAFLVTWDELAINWNHDDNPTKLRWGNKVLLKLNATDLDGLPIKRQVALFAGLTDDTKEKFQIQDGTNEFSVACPDVWWSYGAVGYRILIGADLKSPDLVLEIQFTQPVLVKAVAGGVIVAGIVGLSGFLVRVTSKASDRDEAKRLLLSFLQFELLLGDSSIHL
jgi:hypothetical protein